MRRDALLVVLLGTAVVVMLAMSGLAGAVPFVGAPANCRLVRSTSAQNGAAAQCHLHVDRRKPAEQLDLRGRHVDAPAAPHHGSLPRRAQLLFGFWYTTVSKHSYDWFDSWPRPRRRPSSLSGPHQLRLTGRTSLHALDCGGYHGQRSRHLRCQPRERSGGDRQRPERSLRERHLFHEQRLYQPCTPGTEHPG